MFSMITGCPSSVDMPWASPRPKMSAGPPAGNGTIMRTGLVGYACASASSGTRSKAASSFFKYGSFLFESIDALWVVAEQCLPLGFGRCDFGDEIHHQPVVGNLFVVGRRPVGAPERAI